MRCTIARPPRWYRRNGIPSPAAFGYDGGLACGARAMNRLIALGALLAFACLASPVAAGEYGQIENTCYQCMRDAIYADIKLIDRLEANPDIDDGIKGPQIIAARADIHRVRTLLGPLELQGTEPCCYTRRPLYIR
jgi:hypothetical protein